MAVKRKPPAEGPSKAYLMSFGDTMTTLLAFFIVLNAFSQEQTGANMHSGTGSFVQSLNSHGLPGSEPSKRTRNAIARNASSPLYIVADPENRPPANHAAGPDDNENGIRVIDREQDQFERFMTEMERLHSSSELPATRGEAAFDFFEPLLPGPNLLSSQFDEALVDILPMMHQSEYTVRVVVWATTPSPTAWTRATQRSRRIADQLAGVAGLTGQDKYRVRAQGQPWIDSVVKRPVWSIVVQKH